MLVTKLSEERLRHGHTQREAAALAGLPVRSWEGWELVGAHRREPRGRSVARILKIYPLLTAQDLVVDPYVEVTP